MDQSKQSLLSPILELEAALVSAHEHISRKDGEILRLKGLLAKTTNERDEFHARFLDLDLEKQLLFQQVQILNNDGIEDDPDNMDRCSPSDSDDNMGSKETLLLIRDIIEQVASEKVLPEQGRFLLAVMEAAPLLHNLLLAGPLPRWEHPPPHLDSIDIPSVAISSQVSKCGLFTNGV